MEDYGIFCNADLDSGSDFPRPSEGSWALRIMSLSSSRTSLDPAESGSVAAPAGSVDAGPRGSVGGVAAPGAAGFSRPATPSLEFRWTPGADPRTPAELAAFFHSPPIETLKERICDMGRRLWQREYTDGNGGNLTIRVGDNLALCTATLICKGFMKPKDVCLVDLDGRQLAGARQATSEALTHFGIMKRQPAAKACVHAHPPHATAFALWNGSIPQYLIPEVEIFLGQIGVAEYRMPGTPEYADIVGEAARDHQAVLMRNHGVIVWGNDVEDACWKMENIDAYCRMIWIATSLGGGMSRFTGSQAKALIARRLRQGMADSRAGLSESELQGTADFVSGEIAPGGAVGAARPSSVALPESQIEAIVRAVTERVLEQLRR
jgi:L-fuculose-phosphate aldolase